MARLRCSLDQESRGKKPYHLTVDDKGALDDRKVQLAKITNLAKTFSALSSDSVSQRRQRVIFHWSLVICVGSQQL